MFLKSNIRKIIVKIFRNFSVKAIWTQIIDKKNERQKLNRQIFGDKVNAKCIELNCMEEIGKCYFYEHLSTVMVGLESWVHYVNTRFSKSCA